MAIIILVRTYQEKIMFSGIVECIGTIIALSIDQGCKHFVIAAKDNLDDLNIGDSIAINGVCLTITSFTEDTFSVTAVPETLRLTNLDTLEEGNIVNIERSLKVDARIGGHYVQGHVDGVGTILDIQNDHSNALLVKISIPAHLAKYVVNKGYISLDGMSITVIQSTTEWFTVTFIPHTQDVTIVKQYRKNIPINIEVDMMGKQIEKLLGAYQHGYSN